MSSTTSSEIGSISDDLVDDESFDNKKPFQEKFKSFFFKQPPFWPHSNSNIFLNLNMLPKDNLIPTINLIWEIYRFQK